MTRPFGLLLSELDNRPDLNRLIDLLATDADLILFETGGMGNHLAGNFCVETSRSDADKSRYNRILRKAYRYFGNKAKPARYMRSYQLRRLDQTASGSARKQIRKASILLKCALPGLISYDRYLQLVRVPETVSRDVAQLECLLVISDVADDRVLAAAVQQGIPVVFYVYSWDHPAKFTKFPKVGVQTATWSRALAQDLEMLHGLDANEIVQLPSTQYAAIVDHLDRRPRVEQSGHRRVLYAASFGYPTLAQQEIEVFVQFAEAVQEHFSEVEIIFRGYPHLADSGVYGPLADLPNVTLDDTIFLPGRGLDPHSVAAKVETICAVDAVVHSGTTVGIESALCGTPVIYFTMPPPSEVAQRDRALRISTSWEQYHLDRYYDQTGLPNVAKTIPELVEALRIALDTDGKSLLGYGENLRLIAGAKEWEAVSREFLTALRSVAEKR